MLITATEKYFHSNIFTAGSLKTAYLKFVLFINREGSVVAITIIGKNNYHYQLLFETGGENQGAFHRQTRAAIIIFTVPEQP